VVHLCRHVQKCPINVQRFTARSIKRICNIQRFRESGSRWESKPHSPTVVCVCVCVCVTVCHSTQIPFDPWHKLGMSQSESDLSFTMSVPFDWTALSHSGLRRHRNPVSSALRRSRLALLWWILLPAVPSDMWPVYHSSSEITKACSDHHSPHLVFTPQCTTVSLNIAWWLP